MFSQISLHYQIEINYLKNNFCQKVIDISEKIYNFVNIHYHLEWF